MERNDEEILYQITAPHFCAGITANDYGVILVAAPILYYTKGRSMRWLRDYCKKKNWEIIEINDAK